MHIFSMLSTIMAFILDQKMSTDVFQSREVSRCFRLEVSPVPDDFNNSSYDLFSILKVCNASHASTKITNVYNLKARLRARRGSFLYQHGTQIAPFATTRNVDSKPAARISSRGAIFER